MLILKEKSYRVTSSCMWDEVEDPASSQLLKGIPRPPFLRAQCQELGQTAGTPLRAPEI